MTPGTAADGSWPRLRHARPVADAAGRLGWRCLGPVLAAATDWILARSGPSAVLGCVMRDGDLLSRALRTRDPAQAADVRDLWLGRRACLIAALAGGGDADGIRNLLVRARGHPPTLDEAAADLGLGDLRPPQAPDGDAVVDAAACERLIAWLDATLAARDAVDRRARALRATLLAHLDARGALGGRPLVLVDVGYAGNVPRALARILALSGIRVPVRALCLATTPGAVWASRAGVAIEGFLVDRGAPAGLAATLVRSREVLELLVTAPRIGPLVGFGADGAPATAPLDRPLAQVAAMEAVQRAALGFLARAADHPPVPPRHARAILRRLLDAPSPEEAELMGDWLYADPLAVAGSRPLAPPVRGTAAALPRSAVLWPAAALRRSRTAGA